MCLLTTQKTAKIADKDIKTFKLLNKDLHSPYKGTEYELGKLATAEIQEVEYYEAWTSADDAYFCDKKGVRCFGPGLHSCTNKKFLKEENLFGNEIYECIIPEGSLYYRGFRGLTISNQLIVVKKVKSPNKHGYDR